MQKAIYFAFNFLIVSTNNVHFYEVLYITVKEQISFSKVYMQFV